MVKWLLLGIGIWAGLILIASCTLGLLAFVVSYMNSQPPKARKRI